jgi:hypothetical protein
LRDRSLGFSLVALGQPGPQDIARGIHVSVSDMSAPVTAERGAIAVARFDMAALRAGL